MHNIRALYVVNGCAISWVMEDIARLFSSKNIAVVVEAASIRGCCCQSCSLLKERTETTFCITLLPCLVLTSIRPYPFYTFAEKEILLESDVHNDRMMLLDLLILMVSFISF